MTDTDLTPEKDDLGRDILVYAKGKAPKEKPRYSTPPLVGETPETPAPAEKLAPSKPKE